MRRRVFLGTVFLLGVTFSVPMIWRATFSRAQTEQATSTPCCGQVDETAPRELDFPYYSLRDGFSSTVLLVSDLPKPLDFILAVHSRSGQTLLAPSMTIQPQQKLPIDLAALLVSMGADPTGDFAEGSVSVYFNGPIMPLAGQLTMSNPARRLIFESEVVDNSPGLGLLPRQLHALWWGIAGGRDARIMVSNTSGEAVMADVFLDFLGERHAGPVLSFTPHEIKVLSVVQLLGDLKTSPAQAPEGGITIIPRGAKPALIAQGKITDVATGFSTTLNFPDPALQHESALHASGVPIGKPTSDSPFAGTGTFVPHVVVRDLAGTPQTVTVTVEYPGEDGPQQTVLSPFALPAYSTRDVALDGAFDLLPLPLPFCSLRIQYSGPPGSAIAEVSSIEAKGDLVIDSRLANEGDGWAGSGGHPWHLDDETDSVLFLTNMGDKVTPIGCQVQANGIHYYLTDLELKPHETRAVSLRKLRDAQKPDLFGSKIPPDATDGSVVWGRASNVPVMGRLVVMQRHKGVASNYDCTLCQCGFRLGSTSLHMSPPSATIVVGGSQQFNAIADMYDCYGNYYPIPVTYSSGWSSSPSSVASVSAGNVTGNAGGTALIQAAYSGCMCWSLIGYCCYCNSQGTAGGAAQVKVKPNISSISPPRGLIGVSTSVTISGSGFGTNPTVSAGTGITVTRGTFNDTQIHATFAVANNAPSGNHSVTVSTAQGTSNSVNFYVQVPTGLSLVTTTSQGPASCGEGMAGWDRWVRWQVLDQGGQAIQRAMSVSDSINIGSPNTCGASPETGTASTDSSGQFADHYYLCSTGCIGGTCQTNASQTYTVAGFVLSSDVKSIVYSCSSITINAQ